MPKPLRTFEDVQARASSARANMQVGYGVNHGQTLYDFADCMVALATRCLELERTVHELRDQLAQAQEENAKAHAALFRELDLGMPARLRQATAMRPPEVKRGEP